MCGCTARADQKFVGRAAEIQHLKVAVDQHRSGRKAVQDELLGNAGSLAQARNAPHRRGGQAALARFAEHGGQRRHGAAHAAFAPVNAPLGREGFEQVFAPAHRLGRAQQQVATGAQRKVKQPNDALLHLGLQVNHHVAATDEFHAGKRGVGKQVLQTKHHRFAQRLVDLVALLLGHFGEIAAQPGRGDVRRNAGGVAPPAAHFQGFAAGVGGKYLHRAGFAGQAQAVQHQHGQGVGLFAGGAARHPDANGFVVVFAGHQRRNHVGFQRFPGFGVAEEFGHANEQVAKQRVHLAGVALEQGGVVGVAQHAVHAHAALNAPAQRAAFVARKVVTALGLDGFEHVLQRLGLRAFHGHFFGAAGIGVAGVAGQHLGHAFDRQHVVGHTRGQCAAGHAVKLGRGRVLHQHQAAVGRNGFKAQGAVAAGAREHDTNGPGPPVCAQRIEKMVNRQVQVLLFVAWGQAQVPVDHGHLFVGR